MSILLLKAAKPGIPDADSREQLRWIVGIAHSSDVDEEISKEMIHGIWLSLKREIISLRDHEPIDQILTRVETLHG